jgi:hypothetical protein
MVHRGNFCKAHSPSLGTLATAWIGLNLADVGLTLLGLTWLGMTELNPVPAWFVGQFGLLGLVMHGALCTGLCLAFAWGIAKISPKVATIALGGLVALYVGIVAYNIVVII